MSLNLNFTIYKMAKMIPISQSCGEDKMRSKEVKYVNKTHTQLILNNYSY